MGELEQQNKDEQEDESSDYVTPVSATVVGLGFIVAAVLIIITAGTPAAGVGFVIAAAACLGWGVTKIIEQRHALPESVGKERELLSAIRDNGGITPAEAAMETSLTVKEADEMLTELASGGHLMVESRSGALYYTLSGESAPKLER